MKEIKGLRGDLKPMSPELFLKATYFRGGVDDFLLSLDRYGYWDDKPRTYERKIAHIKYRLKTLKNESGFRTFLHIGRRKKQSSTIVSDAVM